MIKTIILITVLTIGFIMNKKEIAALSGIVREIEYISLDEMIKKFKKKQKK